MTDAFESEKVAQTQFATIPIETIINGEVVTVDTKSIPIQKEKIVDTP